MLLPQERGHASSFCGGSPGSCVLPDTSWFSPSTTRRPLWPLLHSPLCSCPCSTSGSWRRVSPHFCVVPQGSCDTTAASSRPGATAWPPASPVLSLQPSCTTTAGNWAMERVDCFLPRSPHAGPGFQPSWQDGVGGMPRSGSWHVHQVPITPVQCRGLPALQSGPALSGTLDSGQMTLKHHTPLPLGTPMTGTDLLPTSPSLGPSEFRGKMLWKRINSADVPKALYLLTGADAPHFFLAVI